MKRRTFIAGLGAAVALPFATRAQSERMKRLGVLMSAAADDPDVQANGAAFKQGLQQLGWIDGSNVRLETRWGAGNADTIRRQAEELAALVPDVVLASGNAAMEPMALSKVWRGRVAT